MELVEDAGRSPSGQDLLADIPDPCCPVGRHRQFLGFEHAVPEPEPLQAISELRCPARAALRPSAVDADAGRPAAPVLPLLPGLRILAVRRAETMAFASRVFAMPSACLLDRPSTSLATI